MTKYRSLLSPASLCAGAFVLSLGACEGETPHAPPQAPPRPYGELAEPGSAEPQVPQVDPAAVLQSAKPLFAALAPEAKNPANPWTKAKADLGRTLYFDPRLSKNHDVSCNTCHDLAKFGVDVREHGGERLATSQGHAAQAGDRNSPTVYNAAFHLAQFWDGRAADVEEQAKGPILNPVEMAMKDEASVIAMLRSVPGYAALFAAAFPDANEQITYDNMAKAIGAFERKLVTPGRFDTFIGGDTEALTALELAGLKTFMDVGCTQCHSGASFGGSQFQKLGSVKAWPSEDEGRFALTQAAPDKFVFKVPSLRNIAETGPYLHDGSIKDLREIVQKMAEHQTTKGKLSPEETDAIVAFLGALTGEVDAAYTKAPESLPSGPDTPAPNPS